MKWPGSMSKSLFSFSTVLAGQITGTTSLITYFLLSPNYQSFKVEKISVLKALTKVICQTF